MDDPDNAPSTREPIREPQAREQTPTVHQAAPLTEQAHELTGVIETVTAKPTAKGGNRYGVKIGGLWFNTFDKSMGEMSEALKGAQVAIRYVTNDKGYHDLTDMMPTSDQPGDTK
jgi:hypothetical protein